MTTIKTPRDPKPSEEVMGPNHPATTDPGFKDPWRDPGGDVGKPGRVAGRGSPPTNPWPWATPSR